MPKPTPEEGDWFGRGQDIDSKEQPGAKRRRLDKGLIEKEPEEKLEFVDNLGTPYKTPGKRDNIKNFKK